MTTLGYALSCEEFGPNELVRQAGFFAFWEAEIAPELAA